MKKDEKITRFFALRHSESFSPKNLLLRMTKRKAFTLAEVLITLGIIGVVAALTIPTIMHKYREKATITKIKKANSVLAQIYLSAQADNGIFSFPSNPTQSDVEEFFNTYWKPYLKIQQECTSYSVCGYSSNSPYKTINGASFGYVFICDGRKSFITQDGMLYFVVVYTIVNGSPVFRHRIFVDINAGNPPNTFGKDVFTFEYVTNKTVFPFGYELSDTELNQKCSKNDLTASSGFYCAERIRRNGWKVPADYPFEL